MILIIGGTGRLGREVVRLLSASGRYKLRLLVRDPVKAMSLASPSVEIISGGIADANSLGRAMSNVERVFVIPPNVHDQAKLEGRIYRTARRTGIAHVVKVSTVKADVNSTCRFFKEHAIAERHLKSAGVGFTILRPNSYMQNLLWFAQEIRLSRLSLPMGDAKTAPVDIRDVAAVAAAILSERTHDGVTYNITGPEELSFAEIAGELSVAIGREIQYCDVAPAEFTKRLIVSGVPRDHARAMTAAWAVARQGRPTITDIVSKVTKQKPITIGQFSRDYADAFTS